MDDIKTWAIAKVKNKTVRQRVWHSGFFHSFRSATKSRGSFGAKVLRMGGALGRGALKFVPIPILGTLAASAEGAIEKAIRNHHIKSNLENVTSTADIAKWKVKDLSIDDLDRYRKKVEMAAANLKNKIDNFDTAKSAAAQDNKPCNAYADLALAYAQLERRVEILKRQGQAVKIAGKAVEKYADETQSSLRSAYDGLGEAMNTYISSQTESTEVNVIAAHKKCSKYCVARQVINSDSDTWNSIKSGFASLARHTTANVAVSDFAAMEYDHKTGDVSFNEQYLDARN